jgi:ketosteroid isomerase-like protein
VSVEVVAKFFASASAGDIEVAVNCFADDAQWITPDGTVYTKDQIGGLITEMNAMREKMIASGTDAYFEPPVGFGENEVLVKWEVRSTDGKVQDRGIDILSTRAEKIVIKDVLRKA